MSSTVPQCSPSYSPEPFTQGKMNSAVPSALLWRWLLRDGSFVQQCLWGCLCLLPRSWLWQFPPSCSHQGWRKIGAWVIKDGPVYVGVTNPGPEEWLNLGLLKKLYVSWITEFLRFCLDGEKEDRERKWGKEGRREGEEAGSLWVRPDQLVLWRAWRVCIFF